MSSAAFVALNAKAKVAKRVEKSILLDQLLLNMEVETYFNYETQTADYNRGQCV